MPTSTLLLKILGNTLFMLIPCIYIARDIVKQYAQWKELSAGKKGMTFLLNVLVVTQDYYIVDFYRELLAA